jgi:hypothetical protein
MGGKVLRVSALYPRHSLKRMDILATARMVSVGTLVPITGHFNNRLTEADGSEGREFKSAAGDFSCGRRSIHGWNFKPLKPTLFGEEEFMQYLPTL